MSTTPHTGHHSAGSHAPSSGHSDHHDPKADGAALTRLAVSATLHCLTGCAIGEVLGLVLATWWGWSNGPSIALAIGLAFLFGYALTMAPCCAPVFRFGRRSRLRSPLTLCRS